MCPAANRTSGAAMIVVTSIVLLCGTRASFSESIARDALHPVTELPGRFVAWRNANEVVTVDHGVYTVLNVRTLSRARVNDRSPDTDDLRMNFPKDVASSSPPFPGRITNKLSTGGQVVWWKVEGLPVQGADPGSDPTLGPSDNLIDRVDGQLAVYCAPKGHESSEEPPPANSANRGASYSLVHRRGSQYRVLPLEFDPSIPAAFLGSGYRWWNLTSKRDGTTGRYLLFFSREVFLASTKMYGGAGWTPFNVWWLEVGDNPREDSIEHISVPKGPWIDDARSDGPLRRFRCAPFECDYFRTYDFRPAGHRVFLRISEVRDVLSRETLGVYVLETEQHDWLKVGDAETILDQVAPDGCTIALNRKQGVQIVALCPSTKAQ